MDELCLSFYPHCYSLDDILATSEKLSCHLLERVQFLTSLVGDRSSDSSAPPGGDDGNSSRLQLPVWLASFLSVSTPRPLVSAALPVWLRQPRRVQLQADASVVPLAVCCAHFYLSGQHIVRLPVTEGAVVANCLVDTLRARLRPILDTCLQMQLVNASGSVADHPEGSSRAEQLEKSLLVGGLAAAARIRRWACRRSRAQILPDPHVARHRKRKADSALQL